MIKKTFSKIPKLLTKTTDTFDTVCLFFRNVRLWYPILIKDRQFDAAYLYDVMEHKLKLTEELFRSDDTSTENILKHADTIHECRVILTRLKDDDYMNPEEEAYYSRINLRNREENGLPREVLMKWFEEEDAAREKDKKDLFELIAKNIDAWWD